VREGQGSGNYVTQRGVLNFIEVQFGKHLSCHWFDYFLHRHADAVCKMSLAPQENPRLQVPRQFLDDDIKLIKEYMPLIPNEFIFKIGECVFSD
jgi:hypothetical protein